MSNRVESQQVSWWPVFEYACAEAAAFGVDLTDHRHLPVAGSPRWLALPDGGTKLAPVLLFGAQYALLLDGRQAALADASTAVAAAADWPAIAREAQQLNEFRAANPWAKRVIA